LYTREELRALPPWDVNEELRGHDERMGREQGPGGEAARERAMEEYSVDIV
jgi:hypothetical protein